MKKLGKAMHTNMKTIEQFNIFTSCSCDCSCNPYSGTLAYKNFKSLQGSISYYEY
ncbi:hypothetical protein KQI89_07035 [Clostridium sp. MSJ-4]|uniref:Bacteriocin, CLI_3235 family n=1 Tax=Clostridium simiarum TaxID=2841506 RepID=A0ABS6EZ53_9CLOT|nr:hypothetical protein [Clostridium simiarum]MBU5591514.1 hypothetical protein [Clostridium simiarum]